jgi:hypothetical protein
MIRPTPSTRTEKQLISIVLEAIKNKKLGIFIIAYNAEKHLEESIRRIPDFVWTLDVTLLVEGVGLIIRNILG